MAELVGQFLESLSHVFAPSGWSTRRTIAFLALAAGVSTVLALIAFTNVV